MNAINYFFSLAAAFLTSTALAAPAPAAPGYTGAGGVQIINYTDE